MSSPIAGEVLDFHCHHVPHAWPLTTTLGLADAQRRRWNGINRRIADEGALVEEIETGDLAGRIVNIPSALFNAPGEVPPPDTFRRLNDTLAAIVSARQGLHGLASVDAFDGEAGAAEVFRAIRELGHRGIFVESAKGDLLLDAPEARPTLAAAAALGVPVFAHPISPQPLTRQLSRYPRLGVLYARGTVNAATLIALLEGGVFEALPELRVVVTTLALGGVVLAGGFGAPGPGAGAKDLRALLRRHVYVDTMDFNPATIRTAVAFLGADHVLVGSDWPIVNDGPIRDRLFDALTAADIDMPNRRLIAAGNARRLLKLE